MLADMHRARMLAQELPNHGWDIEVLTPGTRFQRSLWVEPDAEVLRPNGVCVHQAALWCDWLFRWLGMSTVGWRALWPMYRLGAELFKTKRFDLVYISTTQFVLFCLGPLWRGRFGVPYILDFHDPWFRKKSDYVTTHNRFKRWMSNWLAKFLESFAVSFAAGVVSVSPDYLFELNSRHARLRRLESDRREVIPFAAAESDFEIRRTDEEARRGRGETMLRIVYTGAGGAIMAKSFSHIVDCLLLVKETTPEMLEGIRIQLFGTYAYWLPGEPKPLEEIAARKGADGLVEEHPARISYLKAVDLIQNAHGLIVLGVDDPSYMPSKLFTYALTGRPLLACLHRDSQAAHYFTEIPNLGNLIRFDSQGPACLQNERKIVLDFLCAVRRKEKIDRRKIIAPFLAPEMARRHAKLFEGCLADGKSKDK